jgi:D-glycero-alpha-D-manno-heptose-7-phosphate kinase
LRISLGGGGTDLPSYYRSSGEGFLVAAGITKYVYVAVHDNFADRYLLKYSRVEDVKSIDEINHPLIRAALEYLDVAPGIEITSVADIPAGTGLGSSGTFAVGLIKALHGYRRQYVGNHEIAAQACHLEIDVLSEPVGKQDQFIAAVGGVTAFRFRDDETVDIQSVVVPPYARHVIEDGLTLFYTGTRRSASDELHALNGGSAGSDSFMKNNLDQVRDAGHRAFRALQDGDVEGLGGMLTDQWKLKLARSPSPIHKLVDDWITAGCEAGALGGKLVGAGGGGFLLFLTLDKARLRARMKEIGLREVAIGIDYQGTTIGV